MGSFKQGVSLISEGDGQDREELYNVCTDGTYI